jgi:hypothetical protein
LEKSNRKTKRGKCWKEIEKGKGKLFNVYITVTRSSEMGKSEFSITENYLLTSLFCPGMKRPFGRIKCQWVNNIKINVREVESGDHELRVGPVEGYCEHIMFLGVV